ncbi:lytic polysaccharide monooxygenase [Pseudomonas poae]|uniref:Chitin-binding protein n=1 Tax=Pseudomonas poae TaxID=200451 RepID=A0A2S9EL87_9PSED|nr:lytic polysaccharide monooxygenase [Pseudomonas poae]PRA32420.1 chitin-binding protein [Pseudomonas poae]PRC16163.1 chitin-binding protein [Pseudomonas poae]
MNNYTKLIIKWTLAATCLAPALGWTHGAVDIPISRQVHCYTLPDFWSGSNSDPGCKAVDAVSGTYPGQQWPEVAQLIKNYDTQSEVEKAVPDGTLCSGGDPKKDGLNIPQATWYRTTVTPKNGTIQVRLVGTAPHVPSFVKIYLSKPDYNPATTKLKWSDLEPKLVYEERMDKALPGSGTPPSKVPGISGHFVFDAKIPAGRSGNAVLFTRWQRIDPAGEGFYNCSDIFIAAAGSPELYDLGQFIAPDIVEHLKVGDSVHFRILDNTPAAKEIVDITLLITQANLDAKKWGMQLVERVKNPIDSDITNPDIVKIGKKQGTEVVFDPDDASLNSVYVTEEGYTKAMSIIAGGGENPGPVNPNPPRADIQGPTTVRAGQTFTLDGSHSVTYNPSERLRFQWVSSFSEEKGTNPTHNFTAPAVGSAPQQFWVELHVADPANETVGKARQNITVTPSGGEENPAYQPNKEPPYKPGDQVSNKGENYKCRTYPNSGWCSQSPAHYEPGVGSDWNDAWEILRKK